MKITLSILTFAASLCTANAAAPLTIKGDIQIKFQTRVEVNGEKPKPGVVDTYAMSINVANSALFRGGITFRPFISNAISSNQTGLISYDIECDVLNPANPAQTRNIGKLFGTAPVDKQNVYRFADGNVKVSVFGVGAAKGFESRFNGLALGKPPAASGMAKLKQDAVRLVSSKGGAITLTKYDKMEFVNHVMAAGPVQIYPEVTVSGTLFYDYGRSAWHFNNVSLNYSSEGKRISDNLTGNVRWIENPNRKTNGMGRYEFDIRVNEPAPSEAAVFATSTDESAFFATDDVTPSLTGTMSYKDTISAGSVVSSIVTVDLSSNKLTKQQMVNLFKLLFISSVVPFNAE